MMYEIVIGCVRLYIFVKKLNAESKVFQSLF